MTIELELPAPPSRPAEIAPPPQRARPAPLPWRRAPEDWERLEPRGLYARTLRGPFLLAVTLALLLPALALALPIALACACVHGPRRVLFAQVRAGRRGRPFVLYKFRTLRDPAPGSDDAARATRLGRFLRNTHLDELPQLWNVLSGEMCLVGPRPEQLAVEAWAARRCPGFEERLVLRPGLTGLAQVTQGYARDGDLVAYREKLARNRTYLSGLSFGLDCAILLRTVAWMLRGRGWRPGQPDTSARP